MTASTSDTGLGSPAVPWVPVDACTLPTADRPFRMAAFDELFATSLREVHRSAASSPGVRLVMAGDQALPGRLRQLAEEESSCCSFFTFTITELRAEPSAAAGQVRVALDIAVPAARADVLEALVERAVGRVTA